MQIDFMMSQMTWVMVSRKVAAETDFNNSDGKEDVFDYMSLMAVWCARMILVTVIASIK